MLFCKRLWNLSITKAREALINKKERKFKIFGYALDDIIRFEPASSDEDSSHSSDSHHSGSSGSSSGSSGGGWSGGGFSGGGSSSSW